MKYIVFEEDGLEDIVIFSKLVNHSDMASRIGKKVLGAGFVRLGMDTASDHIVGVCHGESISLNMKSRPEDSILLNRRLEV